MKYNQLGSNQKVAILLLALGEEVASELLKRIPKEQAIKIAQAMNQLGRVDSNTTEQVIRDFHSVLQSHSSSLSGGHEKASRLIEKAFGSTAEELQAELSQARPRFTELQQLEPSAVAAIVANEHPQVTAVILAHLQAPAFGATLKLLPPTQQVDLIERVARMGMISPEALDEAEAVVVDHARKARQNVGTKKGGVRQVASMLAHLDQETRDQLLANLENRDQRLATDIADSMFVFSDLAKLSSQSFVELMKRVSNDQWKIALRGASNSVQQKVYDQLSERAAAMLREDMEHSPKLPKQDVEHMQRTICRIVIELQKEGLIGADEDYV